MYPVVCQINWTARNTRAQLIVWMKPDWFGMDMSEGVKRVDPKKLHENCTNILPWYMRIWYMRICVYAYIAEGKIFFFYFADKVVVHCFR